MKLTKSKLKQIIREEVRKIIKEEAEPMGDYTLGERGLNPNVNEGTELFWYETAEGEMLGKEEFSANEGRQKISGVVISISEVDVEFGSGPYVKVKINDGAHAGGTMEIDPEWWDSIYMMGEI